MSNETAPFISRICRYTAEIFAMPPGCLRRNCRRTDRCLGDVSADGEPPCISRLKADDRQLFALHVTLARVGACELREGKIKRVAREPFEVHSQRLGRLVAVHTLADLAANRAILRKRLRDMKITTSARRPTRPAATFYRHFGAPAEDADRSDSDAAAGPKV